MFKKLVMVLFLSVLALCGLVVATSTGILAENNYYFVAPNATEIHHLNQIHQILFSVESASMTPNLNVGDLVVAENTSKIITWGDSQPDSSKTPSYISFNNPGDVILYRPYGKPLNQSDPGGSTPVLHRALRFVNQGQPMWDEGPKAPFAGYITKGDHNNRIDQMAGAILGMANSTYIKEHNEQIIEVSPGIIYIDKKTGLILYIVGNKTYVGEGISYLTPVKKEWILGVARARIPNGTNWANLSASYNESLLTLANSTFHRSNQVIEKAAEVSVDTFGVQGNFVDMSFNSLEDLLHMSPENTVFAYWINLNKSQNLTDAAREALPTAIGLSYGDRLYQNKIERLGAVYFNNSSTEFHWIKPYGVACNSLMIPYNGYMMIPQSSDYAIVLGRPVLFGPQKSLESVLDVISRGLPTDKFTLPSGKQADLQVASLAGKKTSPSGTYQELYLGVAQSDSGYALYAKYLNPDSIITQKAKEISNQYKLVTSSKGEVIEVLGTVDSNELKDVLKAFLA